MKQITEKVRNYLEVRGWLKIKPADVAKSIVIEAAELLEHYQWSEFENSDNTVKNKEDIELEVADIFIYLIDFCIVAGIDLEEAFNKKMKIVEEKYPVSMFNGKHDKDAYMKQKKLYRGE